MTTSRFPWDAIPVPLLDLKLLRVDDAHHHDFSWGKDSSGKLLLLLALPGVDTEGLNKRKIELTGIKTDIRGLPEAGQVYFQLTLLTSENIDIFHTLCKDLIERTRTVPDLSAAIHLVYQRLERWRAFLSKASKSILTRQEVQGLFAELSFLEKCLDEKAMAAQTVVEGWQGPLGAPHDFIFGPEAIEVKSVSGSSVDGVRISSERQLITHLSSLYMHVVFLMQDAQCRSGLSLNTLVNRIREKITGDVLSAFDGRLSDFGYIDIPEYDWPCFAVSQTRTYGIKDDFPRITPNTIPLGVSDVSYSVKFSSIEEYLIENFSLGRQS